MIDLNSALVSKPHYVLYIYNLTNYLVKNIQLQHTITYHKTDEGGDTGGSVKTKRKKKSNFETFENPNSAV